jgi:S1-C subfamily serine protease
MELAPHAAPAAHRFDSTHSMPRVAFLTSRILAAGLIALLLAASGLWAQESEDDSAIEDAVVLIDVTSQHWDWYSPWQAGPISRGTGSGFLIRPGTILTNAHVVSDARQVLVRRNGNPAPAFAEVAFIAHDADLAMLRVKDPDFDRGVRPLDIGELPNLRTRVRTYGYPAGGEQISRTEGVVSRVEFVTYLHSGADSHLAIQTDSAINPGNSGGPVMQDGKVVGMAFQTSTRLNDVGYFIPTPVIKRFLRDIQDGRYDGYAELGVVTSDLFNASYRKYLGLPPNVTGVVVDRVLPGASATGVVKDGDVLTAIDGVPIALDGSIRFHGHTVQLEQIVEDKLIGENVELSLFRDRAPLKVGLRLGPLAFAERMRNRFDVRPDYLIYAGLVFVNLDQEYLRTMGNFWERADKPLLYAHFFSLEEQTQPDLSPPIIVSRVLPHAINSAYRGYANALVGKVNGKTVKTLAELDQALQGALDGFQVIELEGGREIVLNRKEAEEAHRDILRAYGIREERRPK